MKISLEAKGPSTTMGANRAGGAVVLSFTAAEAAYMCEQEPIFLHLLDRLEESPGGSIEIEITNVEDFGRAFRAGVDAGLTAPQFSRVTHDEGPKEH